MRESYLALLHRSPALDSILCMPILNKGFDTNIYIPQSKATFLCASSVYAVTQQMKGDLIRLCELLPDIWSFCDLWTSFRIYFAVEGPSIPGMLKSSMIKSYIGNSSRRRARIALQARFPSLAKSDFNSK